MSSDSDFSTGRTVVPAAASADFLVEGAGSGSPRKVTVLPFDIEAIRLMLSAKYVRPIHIVGYLGGSASNAYDRLRQLKKLGYVTKHSGSVNVPENIGEPPPWKHSIVPIYSATKKAADHIGYWQVLGHGEGVVTSPSHTGFSYAQSVHTLAVADVACVFKRYGAQVVFEREFKSVEILSNTKSKTATTLEKNAPAIWCPPTSERGRHSPDLGLILPDEARTKIGVEVELNTKPVVKYMPVIQAYIHHGLSQLWLVNSGTTIGNLQEAIRGITGSQLKEFSMGPGHPPVYSNDTGTIRIQYLRGSFTQPSRQKEISSNWQQVINLGVPGGYRNLTPVPLEKIEESWRIRNRNTGWF